MTVTVRIIDAYQPECTDKEVQLDVEPDTPLLYALRNDMELNGPKFGCGMAQCGACVVLMDGKPVRSCVVPVAGAVGRTVVTLEGLGDRENPHPLQTAFIEQQAMQCGYCSNGMMMTAAAMLEKNDSPTEEQIRAALRNNLCRCGARNRIVRAVSEAARSYRKGEAAQGPAAAAIAIAVANATGARIRDLPLTPARLKNT